MYVAGHERPSRVEKKKKKVKGPSPTKRFPFGKLGRCSWNVKELETIQKVFFAN